MAVSSPPSFKSTIVLRFSYLRPWVPRYIAPEAVIGVEEKSIEYTYLKLPLYFLSTKHFLSQVFWEFWRMRMQSLPGPLPWMGPGSRLGPSLCTKQPLNKGHPYIAGSSPRVAAIEGFHCSSIEELLNAWNWKATIHQATFRQFVAYNCCKTSCLQICKQLTILVPWPCIQTKWWIKVWCSLLALLYWLRH